LSEFEQVVRSGAQPTIAKIKSGPFAFPWSMFKNPRSPLLNPCCLFPVALCPTHKPLTADQVSSSFIDGL